MNTKIAKLFDSIILALIGAVFLFTPFVVNKNTRDYSEWPKSLWVLGVVGIMIVLCVARSWVMGKFEAKKFPINFWLQILAGVYAFTALTSVDRFESWFGGAVGTRLPAFLWLALIVLLGIFLQVVNSERVIRSLTIILGFGFSLGLLQMLGVITPLGKIFGGDVVTMYTQVFDCVWLAPAILILGLGLTASKKSGLVGRILGLTIFIISLLTILIIKISFISGIILLVLVCLIAAWFYNQKVVWSGAVVASAIGAVVLIVGLFLPTRALFKVQIPSEVTLDLPASRQIMSEVFGSSAPRAFVGYGPNTFHYTWSQFHPVSVNYTTFWQTRFYASGSALYEYAQSTGLMGIVAGLIFLAIVLLSAVKYFNKMRATIHDNFYALDNADLVYILSLIVAFVLTTVALFVGSSGVVTWVFWFALIGLLFANIYYNQNYEVRVKVFFGSHRRVAAWGLGTLLFLGILGLVSLTYYRVYLADVIYGGIAGLSATDQINQISRAIELNPERADFYVDLADRELREGKRVLEIGDMAEGIRHITNAMQIMERAANEKPREIRVYEELIAVNLELSGRVADSKQWLIPSVKTALKLEPSNPGWYVLMGDALSLDNKNEEAIGAYTSAINLKRDWNIPYIKLAELYGRDGEVDKALEVLSGGLKYSLNDVDYLILLGATYFNRDKPGDAKAAIAVLESALQIAPGNKDVLFALGNSYEKTGLFSEALSIYQRLLALSPSDVNVLKALARVRGKVRR